MNRTRRLAAAGALSAVLLPGTLALAAPAAMAEPRPQHSASRQDPTSVNKALAEYRERRSTEPQRKPKAQIEYEERLFLDKVADGSPDAPGAQAFPWAIAGVSAIGLSAVAAGGLALARRQRRPLASA